MSRACAVLMCRLTLSFKLLPESSEEHQHKPVKEKTLLRTLFPKLFLGCAQKTPCNNKQQIKLLLHLRVKNKRLKTKMIGVLVPWVPEDIFFLSILLVRGEAGLTRKK